jgi:hypothetical protein
LRVLCFILLLLAVIVGAAATAWAVAALVALVAGFPRMVPSPLLHLAGAGLGLVGMYVLLRMRMWLRSTVFWQRERERQMLPATIGFSVGVGLGAVGAVALILYVGIHEALAMVACFGCAIAGLMIGLRCGRSTEDGGTRCPVCGYDLRGTPVADDGSIRCSECGMEGEWVVDDEEPT